MQCRWPPVLPVLVCVLLLNSALHVYHDQLHHEPCEMTWMYQYPQYQRLNLSRELERTYPQYSLHLYREGRSEKDPTLFGFDVTFIRPPVLNGIPALFIPGNAGSMKQVRSSASIALRMFPKEFPKLKHFDFFTVNLNEEFSGLFGGVLERQTAFVSACIRHILSLYSEVEPPPHSITIVAHSMGGVVAHALFTLPNFDHSTVHTIVSLASPLKRPVLSFDQLLQQFYDRVEKDTFYLRMRLELKRQLCVWSAGGVASHVTVVSIAGGERDIQVPAHLTRQDYSINIATPAVPRNWVSADHQAVVWCRRVQLAVGRVLFHLQDVGSRDLTYDTSRKTGTFAHYLFRGKEVPARESQRQLTVKGWKVLEKKHYWQDRQEAGYAAVAVPHSQWAGSNQSLLVAAHTSRDVWVYICATSEGSKMANCTDMSTAATLLPPKEGVAKFVILRAALLPPGTTHTVLLPPQRLGKAQPFVLAEQCDGMEYALPLSALGGHLSIVADSHCTLLNISLPDLIALWQVYRANISSCAPIKAGLVTPWYHHTLYRHSNSQQLSTSLSLLVSPPPASPPPHLLVWANHSCSLEITLSLDVLGSLNKLLLLYAPLLPPWVAAISLSAPASLLHTLAHLTAITLLLPLTRGGWLPGTDWQVLLSEGLWGDWSPPLLYLLACGLWQLLTMAVGVASGILQKIVSNCMLWTATYLLIGASLLALCLCSGLSLLFLVLAYALHASTVGDTAHQTLCVLVCHLFLTFPSLFSWAKGLSYELRLFPDPHFWTTLVLDVIVIATLIQSVSDRAKKGKSTTTSFCGMLYPFNISWERIGLIAATMCALLYASLHTYRTTYFTLAYITLSALKQLLVDC